MKKTFTRKFASAFFLAFLFHQFTYAQLSFTIVDTLPEGAYGNAAWGDYDGDGYGDIAYLTQAIPNPICYVYHYSNGGFTKVSQYFPPVFSPGVEWGDLNNDGFDDLIVSGLDTTFHTTCFIYKSNGDGTFTSEPNTVKALSAGSIDIADYNNDGLKDFAINGFDDLGINHAFIYRNDGDFNFTKLDVVLKGTHFGELKWGDYNNDGLADLVIDGDGNANVFRTRVYKNSGGDDFELQDMYMKGAGGTVDWLDYDNDGWLDILVTGYDSTFGNVFTELHHNNGDGTFSLANTNLPGFGEPSCVAVNDFNNDGNVDVCFMGGDDTYPFMNSALTYGDGTSTFTIDTFFKGNVENAIVDDGDFDQDGDVDLVWDHFIIRNDLVATSVENNYNSENFFNVYPNPANEFVGIKTTMFETGGTVTLKNSLGETVMEFAINENLSGQQLPLPALPAGLYLLKVISKSGTTTVQPLVIEK